MFELNNEQRRCFGLPTVEAGWVRLELKASPYDEHQTVAYLDGDVLRKFIASGEDRYAEYEISERVSEDREYLLPRTQKGKPVLLTAASLQKRTPQGMCLSFFRHRSGYGDVSLHSDTSQKNYYTNEYMLGEIRDFGDFQRWIEDWCADTTPEDIADLSDFAAQPRSHQKFREGDVFRFKIGRRQYGYGRILLDYAQMRKKKEPFWDVFMGKPVVCSVYRIVTDRKDVTVQELQGLGSLPSTILMDNRLYYGEFEILGNLPVGEREDYPIFYGNSISALDNGVRLQCGKIYRRKDDDTALYRDFTNNGVGFGLGFSLAVLQQCIREDSNAPYWAQDSWKVNRDLRNPKFREELERVCGQFDLKISDLIPS